LTYGLPSSALSSNVSSLSGWAVARGFLGQCPPSKKKEGTGGAAEAVVGDASHGGWGKAGGCSQPSWHRHASRDRQKETNTVSCRSAWQFGVGSGRPSGSRWQKGSQRECQFRNCSPGYMEQAPSRGHKASPHSGLGVGCGLCPSSKSCAGRVHVRRCGA
jgi:hypothetical protein